MGASQETGRILKDARLASGRSLEELSQATRINARFLSEVEEGGAFSLGDVYRKTFVRTYARALGIEPDSLPGDEPPALPAAEDEPPRSPAGELASGPPVDEMVTTRLGRNPFAEKSQVRTMTIVVILLLAALVLSVKWLGSDPDKGPGTAPAGGEDSDPAGQERLPAYVGEGGAGGADPAGGGGGRGSPTAPADSLVLRATTTESVWVHIVIDNDSTVEYTLPPGYALTLRARDNFLLAVGNPSGLSLSLNGRRIDALGEGSRPVKNVFLSRKSIPE